MRCSLIILAAGLLPAAAQAEPCKTGCSIASHDIPSLDDPTIATLVGDLDLESTPGADSAALESLLFHAESVRRYVDARGPEALGRHRALIERELTVTHAVLQLRVVDEAGVTRARFAPTRVPLGHKTHHPASASDKLPGLILSGTVVRVGLEHVWSRL